MDISNTDPVISDMRLDPLQASPFIKIQHVDLTLDNGQQIQRDIPKVHDRYSVSILLYHSTRQSLIVVKQFRPAVFLHSLFPKRLSDIDHFKIDPHKSCSSSPGFTYELCDGIMDKPDLSAVDVAREEILEECGFDVPVGKVELVTTHRSMDTGALQWIFYAEIDDSMKINEGGGNRVESEDIQIIYVPVDKARQILINDESVQRSADLMFSVLWFLENKYTG